MLLVIESCRVYACISYRTLTCHNVYVWYEVIWWVQALTCWCTSNIRPAAVLSQMPNSISLTSFFNALPPKLWPLQLLLNISSDTQHGMSTSLVNIAIRVYRIGFANAQSEAAISNPSLLHSPHSISLTAELNYRINITSRCPNPSVILKSSYLLWARGAPVRVSSRSKRGRLRAFFILDFMSCFFTFST